MYKIGNQIILVKEIFSVGELFVHDGRMLYLDIYAKSGAKVPVVFNALKTDCCSSMGRPSEIFMDRIKKEIEFLINEVDKSNV